MTAWRTGGLVLLGSGLAASALGMLLVLGAPGAHATTAGKSAAKSSHPASTPPAVRRLPAASWLTISVTDGRTRVRPGDRLSYTVRVTDGGTAAARGLKITLTLPGYLQDISADRHARASAGKVTWSSSLRPGQEAVFRLTARLARTPHGLVRLAVVACAAGGSGKATVCAAHLDTLPGAGGAGGASGSRRAAPGTGGRTTSAGELSGFVIGGIAIAAAAALAAFGAARIRARRPGRLGHRHSG